MFGLNLGLNLGSAALSAGAGVPYGYTRTTYNGEQVTFNGAIVFDDGKNFYYMRAS